MIDNPANNAAFLRVVNFPARGIGARTIENLQEMARMHDISLFEAIPYVSGKGGTALGSFIRLIQSIRAEVQPMNLPTLIQTVLEKSGLMMHYQTEKEGADRLENLEQLGLGSHVVSV